MKHSIKSIFEQISEQVFRMTNLSEAQAFVVDFVNSKNINDQDKKKIVYEAKNAKSLTRFQTYICNSLLKYEGMSVNFSKETTI
jgi:hypothetical protein